MSRLRQTLAAPNTAAFSQSNSDCPSGSMPKGQRATVEHMFKQKHPYNATVSKLTPTSSKLTDTQIFYRGNCNDPNQLSYITRTHNAYTSTNLMPTFRLANRSAIPGKKLTGDAGEPSPLPRTHPPQCYHSHPHQMLAADLLHFSYPWT